MGWNKAMGEKVTQKFVLFFECNQETCVKRCLGRGAAGSGRSDDNEESLKKRFDTYVNSTMPIIEHFRELNLVHEIDATISAEEVYANVKPLFEK
jgi:UMP-CMP kinase